MSIQLFGADPEVMRSAAPTVAAAGADPIDINMGCPVPKVCRTGAGAALLADPDRAVALARAAVEGRRAAGDGQAALGPARRASTDGFALAHRLVAEAGVAAIALSPAPGDDRAPRQPRLRAGRRAGRARCDAPVILSGGLARPTRCARPSSRPARPR